MSLEQDFEQMPTKEKLILGAAVVVGGVFLWNYLSNKNATSTTATLVPSATSIGSSGSSGSTSSSSGGTNASGTTTPTQVNVPQTYVITPTSPTPSHPVSTGSTLVGVGSNGGQLTGTVVHGAPTVPIGIVSVPIATATAHQNLANTQVYHTSQTNVATVIEGQGQTTKLTNPVAITTGNGYTTNVQQQNGAVYTTTTQTGSTHTHTVAGQGGGYLPVPIPGATSHQSMLNTQVISTPSTNGTTVITGRGQHVTATHSVVDTTAAGYNTYATANNKNQVYTTTVASSQANLLGGLGAYNVNVNRAGGQYINHVFYSGHYNPQGKFITSSSSQQAAYNKNAHVKG